MDDDIQGPTYEKGGYHQLLGPLLKCNKQRYQYSHKMKKEILVDLNKDSYYIWTKTFLFHEQTTVKSLLKAAPK